MTLSNVMTQLRSVGTAQNRKVYARHGVGENMFGVSFANIRKLAKPLKGNDKLVDSLWKTENHDARVMAMTIANPGNLTIKQLNRWATELDNYVIADALSDLVAKTKHARSRATTWIKSRGEWIAAAGWTIISILVRSKDDLDFKWLNELIDLIELKINSSPNRTRYAMNRALISIGRYDRKLATKAISTARKIGKVKVDHGVTGCKTHDAVKEIEKFLEQ